MFLTTLLLPARGALKSRHPQDVGAAGPRTQESFVLGVPPPHDPRRILAPLVVLRQHFLNRDGEYNIEGSLLKEMP